MHVSILPNPKMSEGNHLHKKICEEKPQNCVQRQPWVNRNVNVKRASERIHKINQYNTQGCIFKETEQNIHKSRLNEASTNTYNKIAQHEKCIAQRCAYVLMYKTSYPMRKQILGRKWLGDGASHLDSVSRNLTLCHLDVCGVARSHLNSLCFSWICGFIWIHSVSSGLTWSQVVSLGSLVPLRTPHWHPLS